MKSGPIDARVLLHVDDVLGLAAWHDLQILYIAGALRVPHVAILENGCRAVARRAPGGVVTLIIVRPDAPLGGAEVRRRLAQLRSEVQPLTRHTSVVIEGGGVWARTVRTLLRGFDLLAAPAARVHIYGTVDNGCQGVLPLLRPEDGARPRLPELQQVIAVLRARVGAAGAAARDHAPVISA